MFILFWGHRESGTRFEFFFPPFLSQRITLFEQVENTKYRSNLSVQKLLKMNSISPQLFFYPSNSN